MESLAEFSDSGSFKQLIFILFKCWSEGVSCLAPLPGERASKKPWGNTTIKQVSAAIITISSLQNALKSSGWNTPIYNFAVTHRASFWRIQKDFFFFYYYVPGLPLGSPVQCLLKIGMLQNWPLCWWNSCKETEQSSKIEDNKMLQPENCLSEDTRREGRLL